MVNKEAEIRLRNVDTNSVCLHNFKIVIYSLTNFVSVVTSQIDQFGATSRGESLTRPPTGDIYKVGFVRPVHGYRDIFSVFFRYIFYYQ